MFRGMLSNTRYCCKLECCVTLQEERSRRERVRKSRVDNDLEAMDLDAGEVSREKLENTEMLIC